MSGPEEWENRMSDEDKAKAIVSKRGSLGMQPFHLDDGLVREIAKALREEREACAELADPSAWIGPISAEQLAVREALKAVAAKIRARGR